jgi:hypothetical protein
VFFEEALEKHFTAEVLDHDRRLSRKSGCKSSDQFAKSPQPYSLDFVCRDGELSQYKEYVIHLMLPMIY